MPPCLGFTFAIAFTAAGSLQAEDARGKGQRCQVSRPPSVRKVGQTV
ncbi:hypothetical protein [Boudabousia tangfeifanii]|nr:hypothetical protein [Boudabousia tangfeifanii]